MLFASTRGRPDAVVGLDETLLSALADDGGLYVPAGLPHLTPDTLRSYRGMTYQDLAKNLLPAVLGNALPERDLVQIVDDAYGTFCHPAIAPLHNLDRDLWVLELFHGPTLAFKDFALQLLCRILDARLRDRGERALLIGATSGDTGSAAIDACRSTGTIDLFMMHPKNRVSDVQRRQMTGVAARNVFNLAVDGTFDDCQRTLKALLNDASLNAARRVTAVNSINWTRIAAQIVYYFYAAIALGAPDRAVDFVVPTGNFGNIFAGHIARKMGLPVGTLCIASNRNDILTRFFETGVMQCLPVESSLTPSMDIQISSNFERLLFELYDCDGGRVSAIMDEFSRTGRYQVTAEILKNARAKFVSGRASDSETGAEIVQNYKLTGDVIDPHTCVGLHVARKLLAQSPNPVVVLGTAHPSKFPDTIRSAIGIEPRTPTRLKSVLDSPEVYTEIANDVAAIRHFISSKLGR